MKFISKLGVFIFVALCLGGGIYLFTKYYNVSGYATPEVNSKRFCFMIRLVQDQENLIAGDVLVVEQLNFVDDNYQLNLSKRLTPKLIWSGGWKGVKGMRDEKNPASILPGSFKILTAADIATAKIGDVQKVTHKNMPKLLMYPLSRNPTQHVVKESDDYSHARILVGPHYIYITLEGKVLSERFYWEHNYIYWINEDRSISSRLAMKRGLNSQ